MPDSIECNRASLGCGSGFIFAGPVFITGTAFLVHNSDCDNRRGRRWVANETQAIGYLRNVIAAENEWREKDFDGNGKADYWTGDVATLAQKHTDFDFNRARLAARDRFPLQTIPFSDSEKTSSLDGYLIEVLVLDEFGNPYALDVDIYGKKRLKAKKFGFRATPTRYGDTGINTFQVNETGIIWGKDLEKGIEADPARANWEGGTEPTKSGWGYVQTVK